MSWNVSTQSASREEIAATVCGGILGSVRHLPEGSPTRVAANYLASRMPAALAMLYDGRFADDPAPAGHERVFAVTCYGHLGDTLGASSPVVVSVGTTLRPLPVQQSAGAAAAA